MFAESGPGDASGFISLAEALAAGIAARHKPTTLLVIRVESWFGPKWLRFSGTIMLQLATWMSTLTVPPFLPERIVSQRRYNSPDYREVNSGSPLHIRTEGRRASLRKLASIEPGAAIVWFSGESESKGAGSLMAYIPTADGYTCFYCGFGGSDCTDIHRLRGISRSELLLLMEARDFAPSFPA